MKILFEQEEKDLEYNRYLERKRAIQDLSGIVSDSSVAPQNPKVKVSIETMEDPTFNRYKEKIAMNNQYQGFFSSIMIDNISIFPRISSALGSLILLLFCHIMRKVRARRGIKQRFSPNDSNEPPDLLTFLTSCNLEMASYYNNLANSHGRTRIYFHEFPFHSLKELHDRLFTYLDDMTASYHRISVDFRSERSALEYLQEISLEALKEMETIKNESCKLERSLKGIITSLELKLLNRKSEGLSIFSSTRGWLSEIEDLENMKQLIDYSHRFVCDISQKLVSFVDYSDFLFTLKRFYRLKRYLCQYQSGSKPFNASEVEDLFTCHGICLAFQRHYSLEVDFSGALDMDLVKDMFENCSTIPQEREELSLTTTSPPASDGMEATDIVLSSSEIARRNFDNLSHVAITVARTLEYQNNVKQRQHFYHDSNIEFERIIQKKRDREMEVQKQQDLSYHERIVKRHAIDEKIIMMEQQLLFLQQSRNRMFFLSVWIFSCVVVLMIDINCSLCSFSDSLGSCRTKVSAVISRSAARQWLGSSCLYQALLLLASRIHSYYFPTPTLYFNSWLSYLLPIHSLPLSLDWIPSIFAFVYVTFDLLLRSIPLLVLNKMLLFIGAEGSYPRSKNLEPEGNFDLTRLAIGVSCLQMIRLFIVYLFYGGMIMAVVQPFFSRLVAPSLIQLVLYLLCEIYSYHLMHLPKIVYLEIYCTCFLLLYYTTAVVN